MRHEEFIAARDSILTELRAHVVHRRDQPSSVWIPRERAAVHTEVNRIRAQRGKGPVPVEEVMRAEALAVGHSDYMAKFSLWCAELVRSYIDPFNGQVEQTLREFVRRHGDRSPFGREYTWRPVACHPSVVEVRALVATGNSWLELWVTTEHGGFHRHTVVVEVVAGGCKVLQSHDTALVRWAEELGL